jgi:eukaryotic-like serine/threonine-protein kinase
MSHAGPTPEESYAADLSGRELGNLHFIRRLGQGAMADVYLAEQSPLKRYVAVKVLKRELAADETYLRRFEREAQAAASLVHANIVQIHEVGHVDGLHYIVQEYVQGQNLRQWLARHGPPELRQALGIMRQVAAALAKAAEAGIVHRDIKPENIMLTASGEVKVADFGLARQVRESDGPALTQIGITMGTPLYMSPEQVEGKPLDPRSDLYSFGVTCFHMLAGEPPFAGETALAVAVQHVKREPRPLASLRGDLPPALCRAVDRMLAKDPAQRWQSARELLRELYRIHREYPGSDDGEDSAGWDSIVSEPLPRRETDALGKLQQAMKQAGPSRHRGRWLLAGGVLAAFTIAALAAWATVRPQPLLPASSSAGQARVPRQSTVLRQWYYASQIGTEEAWQSVVDYFPEKEHEYHVFRAKQQLARIYLRARDYDRAMSVFDELSNTTGPGGEFRAFGLAGKCGVLSLEGKHRESANVLDELWLIHDQLQDVQMRRMLDYVIKENRSKLGPQTAPEWKQWLDEQFHPRG